MSTEVNKSVVRRWFEEVLQQGNLAITEQIMATDYLSHDPGPTGSGWPRGLEGAKAIAATYHEAFPDLHFTLEDQIVEGDKVVTRWTAHGTNTGSLFGMPPTGKKAILTGIQIDRITSGKFTETWVNFDTLGMLQQLGVIPVQG